VPQVPLVLPVLGLADRRPDTQRFVLLVISHQHALHACMHTCIHALKQTFSIANAAQCAHVSSPTPNTMHVSDKLSTVSLNHQHHKVIDSPRTMCQLNATCRMVVMLACVQNGYVHFYGRLAGMGCSENEEQRQQRRQQHPYQQLTSNDARYAYIRNIAT
jgi:hypothetical protein